MKQGTTTKEKWKRVAGVVVTLPLVAATTLVYLAFLPFMSKKEPARKPYENMFDN